MEGITSQMLVAMNEAREPVRNAEGLIEKLRAAMNATRDHWLCVSDDQRFRAAVGAVMLDYGTGTPEFKRLECEMRGLQQLSALINAAEAGLVVSGFDLTNVPDGYEPVGLLGLWHEGKSE